jgi:hypothetical protein
MIQLALACVACSFVAFAVTETHLFKPLRERADKISYWLGALLSCGFCFGTWIAAALVAALRLNCFESACAKPVGYTLTACVVSMGSAFLWAGLCVLVDLGHRPPGDKSK